MAEHKMRYLAMRQAGDPLPGEEDAENQGVKKAAEGADSEGTGTETTGSEEAGTEEKAAEGAGTETTGTETAGTEKKENAGAATAEKSAGMPVNARRSKDSDEIWVKKDYVLFDLDGTLTDPKIGITTCVQYALKSFGIDEPDLDKLETFIGPPLQDSFKKYYGFDDKKAQEAVEKYRERFKEKGMFENELYAGIPEMLKRLKMRGIHLGVASSKPAVYVEQILEHFHIKDYFEVIVGSELDGRRTDKAEVILEAIRWFSQKGTVQKHRVLMVGDRSYDVDGAKRVGIESVGVTFGYGSMQELMEAHADYIVRSVEELKRFLLRGFEDVEKILTTGQKTWLLISQFVLFLAARELVKNLGLLALASLGVKTVSDDLGMVILGASYVAAGFAIFKVAKGIVLRMKDDMHLTHLKPESRKNYWILGIATIALSFGVTMLMNLSGFGDDAGSFQKIASNLGQASLWTSLFTYGLIIPIAEEMLFRGIAFGYARKFFDVRTAIIGSAILFGAYCGNMEQALFLTVMGYFVAYAYEYFGSFLVPVLMHVGMNMVLLLAEYAGLGGTFFVSWPSCVIFMIVGCTGAVLLARQKKI